MIRPCLFELNKSGIKIGRTEKEEKGTVNQSYPRIHHIQDNSRGTVVATVVATVLTTVMTTVVTQC